MKKIMHLCFITSFFLVSTSCKADISVQSERLESTPITKNKEGRETFFKQTGIELPPSSRIIHFSQEEGGELYIRTKMEMDSETFKTWIKKLLREEKHFTADKRYYLEPDSKNWLPSKEKTMLAEQIIFEGGKVLNIGFVNSEHGNKIIYIIFHGT